MILTHDAHGRRQQVQPYLPNAAPPATERPPGWKWAYNPRGEVENAARFTAVGGPVNGVVSSQARSYSYDRMGNRLSLTQGSGAEAITKQTPFQFMNKSQQPLRLFHFRTVELTGAVSAGSVGIVSGGVTRGASPGLGETGEPDGFRTLVQLGSPEGTMLRTTVSSGSATREGYLYVPPAEEVLGYDTRGNLMKDARWEYTWDVNNRLVEIHEYPMLTMAVNAGLDGHYPLRRIRFAYDYFGRRIAKTVWVYVPWQGSAWSGWRLEKDLRYVYDGWQMIAELDHTFAPPTAGRQPAMTWPGNGLDPASAQAGFGGFTGISGVAAERSVVRTYLWGQDLSGTMTGAGGVGGLLSVTHQGVTYHTCSDANGNITGLLAANGADAGQLIARFDYDPFGNCLTNTGPDVEICPMGFSSKYTDSETGLVDFGMRIYSPPLARFLSRDPIEEQGGINLYGMVGNDPVNRWDYLGLADISIKLQRNTRDLFGTYGQLTITIDNAILKEKMQKGEACCRATSIGPYLTIELPPKAKNPLYKEGGAHGEAPHQYDRYYSGLTNSSSGSGYLKKGSVTSVSSLVGQPERFRPKDMTDEDWKDMIDNGIAVGNGEIMIHMGLNSSWSGGCILIGTQYVAKNFTLGTARPNAIYQGVDPEVGEPYVTHFNEPDTAEAQVRLTQMLWCAQKTLGKKLSISFSRTGAAIPPKSYDPNNMIPPNGANSGGGSGGGGRNWWPF